MLRLSLARLVAASVAALTGFAGISAAKAEDVLVAVAANFAEALQDLAALYEKASGNRIVITTGATGKLYAQVKQGAPFQILLSADAKTPAKLEEEKVAVAGTKFTYAVGKLALWSLDARRIVADGAMALSASDFQHLAIANPELAPYGVAAQETLQSLGLWDKLGPRIVMGENIGQTHSMVATGNAELGFVALSAVQNPKKPTEGSFWVVPQDRFTQIRQDAILLNAGAENVAAQGFLDFLQSPEAHALIESYGYGVE
jgi:molybdate transport system substrate-binding protein